MSSASGQANAATRRYKPSMAPMKEKRDALIKRALTLEYATVGWNVIEAVVAIGAGLAAGSVALIGFGLDSIIEVTAAVALIWRLTREAEEETNAERRALLIVGLTFFALAAYVAVESAKTLWFREAPRESLIGIALAVASGIIMPWLGLAKRRLARQLGSKALAADAVETLVCAWLSAILLAGLGLNSLFNWWWADPVAGLLMAGFIVREGWEAVEESRGKEGCGC
jgi:divalent metal cation (Fe/Co/Zn/Cd) transporter